MNRVSVLFIHTATLPPLGADVWVHSQIMRYLDPAKFEVHVACVEGTPTWDALSQIPAVRLKAVSLGSELFQLSREEKIRTALSEVPEIASSLAGLVRYIKEHRIRVLHTSDRPRDALACVLLGRLTKAKSIVHVHVGYGEWMSRSLRWSIANADVLVAISEYVAETLVDGGADRGRIHVVLNAIDPPRWDRTIDPLPVRRELGLSENAKVVTCVARIFRPKGQLELVRAFAQVVAREPDAVLLLVGQDYPAGSNHSAELKEKARELGVEKSIVFTGQRSDIPRIMAASDVFAMTSFQEPFGLVYAEAMAMQRPVVALGDGGTPEVVDHDRSGLLVASGDIDGLARSLLTLLGDAGMRRRFGEYGRAQVLQRFTPERMATDVAQLYETLAG